MEIAVTETALREIERQLENNHLHTLKLNYDNEGCGCAVNGVPQLMMAPRTEVMDDSWLHAEGSTLPIFYAKQDAIYFEEHLTLDYKASTRVFILKSSNQIYNANLSLTAPANQVSGGY